MDENKDKELGMLRRLLISNHTILILVFIILGSIAAVAAVFFEDQMLKTLAISIAVAFITATVVDFAYNYVVMKDVERMVSKHLMLSKEVQEEIMKREKIDAILDCSLESIIGSDLKQVVKNAVINKLRAYKNFVRLNASINIFLSNFKNAPDKIKNNFYKVERITKYHEILNTRRLIFIATDNEGVYAEEIKKIDDEEKTYFFLLPSCSKVVEDLKADVDIFRISDVKVDGVQLQEINEVINAKSIGENKPIIITKIFEIPDEIFKEKENKLVTIEYNLHSIIGKWEHMFFEDFYKVYSNIQILFDFSDTNIANCDVYYSFVSASYPNVKKTKDGKKILLFVDDWTLPVNMVCFTWTCENEIPIELNEYK
ncbi:MAG: hypothetical protein CVT88_01175 [Candidatus Altiarchaeales archaeon HGW-Altiarchaeales-1]|nr:MAG: hypothetical protein CVT88_01175 [Candidatus Altiarchaeales archaeon HGW-Altiarchaeales-1]